MCFERQLTHGVAMVGSIPTNTLVEHEIYNSALTHQVGIGVGPGIVTSRSNLQRSTFSFSMPNYRGWNLPQSKGTRTRVR